MAKRRKKTPSAGRTRDPLRRGSGSPAREDGEATVEDTEDPLALPAWSRASSSSEEAQERALFEQAWHAFGRGDFRRCRTEAVLLAEDATSGEVRRRALGLLERMRVDPLALGMAAVALALLLMAVVWTFG